MTAEADGRVAPPRALGAFDKDRPSRAVLDQITNRWTPKILAALGSGPHRFAALQTVLGDVSRKVLADNLHALVRAGMIDRSVEQTVPPQVTYALTEFGKDVMSSLCQFLYSVKEFSEGAEQAGKPSDADG
jgi:DNA-binding HxlR family transcriptional regulator